jgi:4-amino-4-deoxy-L-arabinose transferase-like glycosyltransferase
MSMPVEIWRRTELLGLVLLTAVVYTAGLAGRESTPGPTEAPLLSPARLIAATGHDADGRRLPLFLHAADDIWQQPIPGYAVALSQGIAGESIVAARAMSVAMAIVNVTLLYLVARQLFATRYLPLVCGCLLLATPLHLIEGRSARDTIYVLPFVLVWLLRTLTSIRNPQIVSPLWTGVWLGIGVFSARVAPLQMLALLVLSIALLGNRSLAWRTEAMWLVLGFVAPLVLPGIWFAFHPDAYGDTWGRWVIFKAHLRNPLDGIRSAVNWNTLGTRTSTYWSLLNPATLFLAPETGRPDYADKAAVFLGGIGVLLLIGIRQVVQTCDRATALTLFGGLLAAPIAAATFGESNTLSRSLTIVPFVLLVAAFGLNRLLTSQVAAARVFALVLLVLMPIQFGRFYGYYRSADPGAAMLTIAPQAVAR